MDKQGILLVNKAIKKTSFSIVYILRKITGIKKIGHCGTLDPFATGVMIMLIGKEYTKQSDLFLMHDKEYEAEITLGKTTSTYDSEGEINNISSIAPTLDELKNSLDDFQGKIYQTPPMFSAKKINGQKLYKLARQGISIHREPVEINIKTTLISYSYPIVKLRIECSKGTYIRSIANDLGEKLNCGGYLSSLIRTRSGPFHINECIDQDMLYEDNVDITKYIKKNYIC